MNLRRVAVASLSAGAIVLAAAAPVEAAVNNVVAGPGALFTTFATPVVVTTPGGSVTFSNYDVFPHDVTHDVEADGCPNPTCEPLFTSAPAIGFGESAPVVGVEALEPGTYSFYCAFHNGMPGKLIVAPSS